MSTGGDDGFRERQRHTELFRSDDLESIELVGWDEKESSLLISLLTSWLSDLRDRLADDNDLRTADLIGDLVLRLEREVATDET